MTAQRQLVYGSVCSGIEAATVAFEPLGWKPAWFAENGAFPSAVLAHHYPEVPNLGDICTAHEKDEFKKQEIDLLVGGTPCQPFSPNGSRKGLRDERGLLALRFIEIAEMLQPRWVLWENVPGARSTNGGRDFAAICRLLKQAGYGVAHAVLNARDFGLAQDRPRLLLVGHLGADRRRARAVFADVFQLPLYRQAAQGARHSDAQRDGASAPSAGIDNPIAVRGNSIGKNWTNGPGFRVGGPMYCLTATDHHAVIVDGVARYLMPVEYERLMAFPDGYTDIPDATDSQRYEALGNSMAVPVMRWLGERIAFVDSLRDKQVKYYLPPKPGQIRKISTMLYAGRKHWLVQDAAKYFRACAHRCHTLIEPFAGSGVVGFSLLYAGIIERLILVEKDKRVVNLLQALLDEPDALADRVESFECTLENVDKLYRDEDTRFRWLVQSRLSWHGKFDGGRRPTPHKRWCPDFIAANLRRMSGMRDHVTVIHGDGMGIMREHMHDPRVGCFADPVYTCDPLTSKGRYLYRHDKLDHPALFSLLRQWRGPWLMTQDDSRMVRQLARCHGFDTKRVQTTNADNEARTELVLSRKHRIF